MNTISSTSSISLAKRTVLPLPAHARQVTCRDGTLWITQDNDPRDIILEPGESFTPDRRRHTIVYALSPATVVLYGAAARAAPARRADQRRHAGGLVLE